jgi:hypothetical protein
MYPRWQLDANGITVRAAALLGFPFHIPWSSLERIQTVGWGEGISALKLDGRYLFQQHVTLSRRGARRVRFTPRDMDVFEAAVGGILQGRPEWRRTKTGWELVMGVGPNQPSRSADSSLSGYKG